MIIYIPKTKENMLIDYVMSLIIEDTDTYKSLTIGEDIIIDDSHKIIIFMQTIPNKSNNIIFKNEKKVNVFLCNTEQLTKYSDALIYNLRAFYEYIKNIDNTSFGIMDYSYQNLCILKDNNFIIDNSISLHYVPYQYNSREIEYLKSVKTSNKKVCTCGCGSDKRRKIISDLLENDGIRVDNIIGYGKTRDIELMKYKVLLNIGLRDNYNIYEHIRCDRLIFSGMVVVSEYKNNYQELDIHDLVVWCDPDKFADALEKVLENYNYYSGKITDARILDIANKRKELYINFRNNCV